MHPFRTAVMSEPCQSNHLAASQIVDVQRIVQGTSSHRVVHLGDILSRCIPHALVIPSAADLSVPRPQVALMRSTVFVRASLFRAA